MEVRSISANTDYAIRLLRSAQTRLSTSAARLGTGLAHNANLVAGEIESAKREQSIAAQIMRVDQSVSQHQIDFLA